MLTSIALYIATALLLGQAATACLLLGGRITEVGGRCVAFWDDPAARQVNRLTERAHRANTMMSPILSTHTIVPGLALFAIGGWAYFTGQAPRPAAALEATQSPLAAILAAVIACLVIFSALCLGPRRDLGIMLRYAAYRATSILSLGAIGAFLYLTSFSIFNILSTILLTSLLTSVVMILRHALAVYGILGVLWAPFALAAAVMRIAAIAMIGPLIFVLPGWLSGAAQKGPFGLSYQRQQQISSGEASIPRCIAADTIQGAVRPA